MGFQDKPQPPTTTEQRAQRDAYDRFKRCIRTAIAGHQAETKEEAELRITSHYSFPPICKPQDPRGIGHIPLLFHNVAKVHGVERCEAIIRTVVDDIGHGIYTDGQGQLERMLREQLENVSEIDMEKWTGHYYR